MFGKKWRFWLGFISSILFLSILFGSAGGMKDVQAVGGAYSIVFRAGDTTDYIPDIPYPGSGVGNTYAPIWGNADGDTEGIVPDPDFKGDSSLQPSDMARCQIVPYFFEITVNGDTTPENGSIIFHASWGTETTSGSEFGFNKDYMVYAAFVDRTDIASVGLDGNEWVDLLDEYWIDKSGNEVAVEGTDVAFEAVFQVDGLDNGDTAIVEVWTVLDCAPTDGNPKVTGNIQVALLEAYTNPAAPDVPDAISTGNQTNPITSAGDFQPAPVNLNIYKYDDNIPKPLGYVGSDLESVPWMNTIVVSAVSEGDDLMNYVANEVMVADTLDPWVQIMSDQPYDIFSNPFGYSIVDNLGIRTCGWTDDDTDGLGGTLTCDLVQMAELDTVTITYWVKAVAGVPIGSVCEGVSETAPATSVADECLISYLSPQGYDVMNRVDLTTVSEDITLDDNWDEEPKDINYPNAVDITSFTATGVFKSILLEWSTLNEDEALLGYNVYVSASEDGIKTKLNDALILPDIFGGGAADYEILVFGAKHGLIPFHTYFFWLEDVNQSYSSFTGPLEVTITPPGKNK
jgi:hypothetical protein